MSRVNVGAVVTAVVDLVRANVPTGVVIGDGRAPSIEPGEERLVSPVGNTVRPYGIVWGIPGGALIGDSYLGQAGSIQAVRVQVEGYGVQRDQAAWLADLMVGILVDASDSVPVAYVHTLTIPGHSVIRRVQAGQVPQDNGGGVVRCGWLVDVEVQAD